MEPTPKKLLDQACTELVKSIRDAIRPKGLGKLYPKSTYTSRSAIDKNLLSALDTSLSKNYQGSYSPTRNGGGFLTKPHS